MRFKGSNSFCKRFNGSLPKGCLGKRGKKPSGGDRDNSDVMNKKIEAQPSEGFPTVDSRKGGGHVREW